jgi:hypothetical protein
MTCVRSASYSCWHCFFRSLSLGLGVPFGTGVFFLAAMHFLGRLALGRGGQPVVVFLLGDDLVTDGGYAVLRDAAAAAGDDECEEAEQGRGHEGPARVAMGRDAREESSHGPVVSRAATSSAP